MTKNKKTKKGLTVKKSNFSEWYQQIIQKAKLADYTKVSGAIVFMPRAYFVWEKIQDYLDEKIKKAGVQNAYFPSLIPESLLKKEAQHVKGFSPEVAWVTHAGSKKLNKKLAIRPTSETIIYDSYKKWIRSYKDLPMKLNQWCNIVRWEFKHPVPFLRTREFLWQEGHSAFASEKQADKEVKQILNIYEDIFEDLLAIPVLKGQKSEKEKFAGALYTLSVETLLPNGKAIQGATSHNLGQNFAKSFDISFTDENEDKKYVWQTSWGLSTRTIGILIAMHSDDKGLILPPKVAPEQIAIIPIIFEKEKEKILKKSNQIKNKLKNYRVILDDREDYTPGWKFNEHELKGVPIRIEIGPKDLKKNQAVLVRRDNSKKQTIKISEINKKIKSMLKDIQKNLFEKAKKFLNENIVSVKNITELKKAVKQGKIAKAKWCASIDCENMLKYKSNGAKSLNLTKEKVSGKCFNCDKKAKSTAYFAKSY